MKLIRNPQSPYASNFAGYWPRALANRRLYKNTPSFVINGVGYSRAGLPHVNLSSIGLWEELEIKQNQDMKLHAYWNINGFNISHWVVNHIVISRTTVRMSVKANERNTRDISFDLKITADSEDDSFIWQHISEALENIRKILPKRITIAR